MSHRYLELYLVGQRNFSCLNSVCHHFETPINGTIVTHESNFLLATSNKHPRLRQPALTALNDLPPSHRIKRLPPSTAQNRYRWAGQRSDGRERCVLIKWVNTSEESDILSIFPGTELCSVFLCGARRWSGVSGADSVATLARVSTTS